MPIAAEAFPNHAEEFVKASSLTDPEEFIRLFSCDYDLKQAAMARASSFNEYFKAI